MLKAVVVMTLIGACYPVALLGLVVVDTLVGDALMARELLYGSHRLIAVQVASGWMKSLIWVMGIWGALTLFERRWPKVSTGIAAVGSVLLIWAAVRQLVPVPSIFAWILFAAFVLRHLAKRLSRRLVRHA